MAKKQTIILSHGSQRPSEEVIKSLKLGEVLVQHAEKAEDAALHTIIGTSGESAQLVSFPSKEYVDSVATSNSAVTALDTRLDAAEGKIDTISGATETNKTNIAKNAEDIAKNAEDIAKNAAAIKKNADDILTKADQSGVTAIDNRLVEAEKTITAHTESISANATAIANAQTAITANAAAIEKNAEDIAKKADTATVNALTERVAANEDAIELINTTIEDNELVTSNALNDLDVRVKANLAKIEGEIARAEGVEDALDKSIKALDAAAIKEIVANDAAGKSIVSKEGNKVTLDFSSFVIDGGEY